MTGLAELKLALTAAWNETTSADPDNWSMAEPAWGQCAVTALAVQDHLGGTLLRTINEGVSHYWNRLPSGDEVDFTRCQFRTWEPGEIIERDRTYVLSFTATRERYERLTQRIAPTAIVRSRELAIVRLRPESDVPLP